MRKAWRLVKKSQSTDAFSGDGARIAGGRWNEKGTSVVYASETLSLAAMELFVHTNRSDLRFPLVYFAIEIPDSVYVEEGALPLDWRDLPAPDSTKRIGTEWVKRNSSCILQVPSIIVSVEFNFILNPAHHDFKKLKIGKPTEFNFDKRMAK